MLLFHTSLIVGSTDCRCDSKFNQENVPNINGCMVWKWELWFMVLCMEWMVMGMFW